MNVVLYPLERVELDGTSISLGMSQMEVEQLIGPGHDCNGRRHYYFNTEMAVDYGVNGKVEFIEFLGGVEGERKRVVCGVSAFDVDAEAVLEILRLENSGKEEDKERGHCCTFRGISVGVYRELTPADVLEMEEEMRREGIPTEGNADLERDRRNAAHWSTIGLGVAGYYA